MDEAQIREQCNRLDDQQLFGLMINRFFSAGQGKDVLDEAELMKNILGQRLGFPIYQSVGGRRNKRRCAGITRSGERWVGPQPAWIRSTLQCRAYTVGACPPLNAFR